LQSVLLPLGAPLSKAYSHNAYQLAILACKEETRTWVFMNYINLVSEIGNRNDPIAFYLPDYPGCNWSSLTPWFEYSVFTRDFIRQCNLSFKGLVKHAIFNQNYIFLYVNEKYIPGTAWHAKGMDFNHNLLLHGYNEATDEVSFLIYDTNRSLTVRSIPVNELEKAFYDNTYSCERNENRMYFFKLREDSNFKLSFDLDYVIEQLLNYQSGKQAICNVMDYHTDCKYSYGLAVYDCMIDHLNQLLQDPVAKLQERVIIPLHLLMEHKQIMVERLKFISELYPHADLAAFIEVFENLKKSFETLRNNGIKLELTGNSAILSKIIKGMVELKKKERNVLTDLINYLSTINH